MSVIAQATRPARPRPESKAAGSRHRLGELRPSRQRKPEAERGLWGPGGGLRDAMGTWAFRIADPSCFVGLGGIRDEWPSTRGDIDPRVGTGHRPSSS